MSEFTHLGKIVEFLHRTDMVDRVSEHPDSTKTVIQALGELAWTFEWDVDKAVAAYNDLFNWHDRQHKCKFVPDDYIGYMYSETYSITDDDLPEFRKLFGFEEPISQNNPKPAEPGL